MKLKPVCNIYAISNHLLTVSAQYLCSIPQYFSAVHLCSISQYSHSISQFLQYLCSINFVRTSPCSITVSPTLSIKSSKHILNQDLYLTQSEICTELPSAVLCRNLELHLARNSTLVNGHLQMEKLALNERTPRKTKTTALS